MGIVIFDGIAYGMLLFLIAVGLSVTMGLMKFVNLATVLLPWSEVMQRQCL